MRDERSSVSGEPEAQGPRQRGPFPLRAFLRPYRLPLVIATGVTLGDTMVALLQPKWLRIGAYWYPRGGMPIDVFWQSGRLPAGVWVPDQGVAPYRGRG